MQTIVVESRDNYEMLIKHKIENLPIPNKQKKIVAKLIMQGFDDGVRFTQGKREASV